MTEQTEQSPNLIVFECKKCGSTHPIAVSEEMASEVMYICDCGRKMYPPSNSRISLKRVLLQSVIGLAVLALLAGFILLLGYAISDYEGFQTKLASIGDWFGNQVGPRAGVASRGEAPPESPVAPAAADQEPVTWTLKTPRGELYHGEPQLDEIHVETAFGPLVVPRGDVRWIVPGLHTPMQLRREIADLIDDLGGDAEQASSAARALDEIGANALAQLREAETGRELQISAAARDVAKQIVKRIEQEPLGDDHVATRYFHVRGQIRDEGFTVKTDLGEIPLAWSELERVDRAELANIEWSDRDVRPRTDPSTINQTPMLVVSKEGNRAIGRLETGSLRVKTPYGDLTVPADVVTGLEVVDDSAVQEAEKAALDLLSAADSDACTAALEKLFQLGFAGASTLQRAAESDHPSIAEEACGHLAELDKNGESYPAGPHGISTADWSFGGTILNQSLQFRCQGESQGEPYDLTVPIDVLRRLASQ